jgi:uncharacterized protein (UPF0276 family)
MEFAMTPQPPPYRSRPSVGLLFNPTTPEVMEDVADLVEHLSVNPGQMFNDLGPQSPFGRRFAFPDSLLQRVAALGAGRLLNGHSFSLSLPTAAPLDEDLALAIARVGERLGGFAWLSEHLNVLLPPRGPEPQGEGGMALPVSYDAEILALLAKKLRQLRERTGLRILLENPALLTPLEEMEMDEPTFLNTLHRQGHCGVLLDLHNLLVSERNGGLSMERYLERLNPEAVEEVHLAGGEELFGVYCDSHSQLTPEVVWSLARSYLPTCPNLRAISFEYNDSYFDVLGRRGVHEELLRMHRLAESCALVPLATGAPC